MSLYHSALHSRLQMKDNARYGQRMLVDEMYFGIIVKLKQAHEMRKQVIPSGIIVPAGLNMKWFKNETVKL